MSKLLADCSFIKRPFIARGKVREMVDCGDHVLMVASDRISAFDVVFNELIPDKGAVLNGLSAFWFNLTEDILPNHVVSVDPADYPEDLRAFSEELKGRSMLVKKAEMLPVECIVRGYLEGSALKSYRQDGTVSGIRLPEGLKQADRLPEFIFTPSTKAEEGHDINITQDEFRRILGDRLAEEVMDASLRLFRKASEYAEEQGLILADTKFEFGLIDGKLAICDELFTPDSSRFWEASEWQPGRAQKSFDKQFLREYLETLDWNKQPPAPALPEEISAKTRERYLDCYRRITGHELGE